VDVYVVFQIGRSKIIF